MAGRYPAPLAPTQILLTVPRCGGVFDKIEDVMPRAELAAHAETYKRLAGFSVEALNAQPPILGALTHGGSRTVALR